MDAVPIQTINQAWFNHYMNEVIQYLTIAGFALGAWKFWRSVQKNHKEEREKEREKHESELVKSTRLELRVEKLEETQHQHN